ncbi:GNAT family N-acetyltransferase [Anaerocolumna chitinilytica]|uniref:N-acetyltransferase n=1 Tax=Anaerocolumna chitinilytica TaxID=1727145 RepID=A0A7I8DQ93_9FIRM|nr:GNAT family N-acetyltransferase [Anaerocolumna chitinilytica]BCJ99484.1 N-acetyltransferase [Anaerocolumna chitinilytica]
MNYNLKENIIPALPDLLTLYNDAGWSNYTKDEELLLKAYHHSMYVLTAWSDDKLVGILRIVGDGYTIVYIQDLLVLKDYQHMGIGSALMKKALNKYKEVYQVILMTDDNPTLRAFYEKMGLMLGGAYGCIPFMKFNFT